MRQVESRVDQAHKRERLWKIADEATGLGIVLFRQQTDVVAQIGKAVKQVRRFLGFADQGVTVREPKAARKKRSLARR
jgi:hypothetical protein